MPCAFKYKCFNDVWIWFFHGQLLWIGSFGKGWRDLVGECQFGALELQLLEIGKEGSTPKPKVSILKSLEGNSNILEFRVDL